MNYVLLAVAALAALVIYDVLQREHAVIRNFPVIGRLRYWLEAVGPELRQYLVTNNNEERPFSRDQRRWVYASSKGENRYFGFGTDNDLEHSSNYLIIKHETLGFVGEPVDAHADSPPGVPCAKVLGAARGRTRAFRPGSIVNISGMSFGSLSGHAVEALNRGAKLCGCLQSTGEGGLSVHHQHGGELIFQLGTSYFGCRDAQGHFDLDLLVDLCAKNPVRAIEIKLSQGAKPGLGGMLPGVKVSAEIAAARGIPVGEDCRSPARHSAFGDVDEMLDFVERLAGATGLPVGIKSAVGEDGFWHELANQMTSGSRGVDFITIDGGEGGTGAAPLVTSDHVALPFYLAMSRVYRIFAERGVEQQLVFIGSGRLGFPEAALLAMTLGCDLIHVAREAMLAIGCIQAQRCHTDHCPTGVATQRRWLERGLDPTLKSVRVARYIEALRLELLQVAQSCGQSHPARVGLDRLEILDDRFGTRAAAEVFGYEPGWGLPPAASATEIDDVMGRARHAL